MTGRNLTVFSFKTMSIKSVMIKFIHMQYTHEFIANVFWRQNIAKVSSITLIPDIVNNTLYNKAYVTIHEWCDSEVAYNFINHLKNPSYECHLIIDNDNWLPVEINTHNDGNICAGDYTVEFNSRYFEREYEAEEVDEAEEESLEEGECREERPIYGMGSYKKYTVQEAVDRICYLNDRCNELNDRCLALVNSREIPAYIEQLEDELLFLTMNLAYHNSKNPKYAKYVKEPLTIAQLANLSSIKQES